MAKKDAGAPTKVWEVPPEATEAKQEPLDLRAANARLLVRRPNVPEVEIPIDRSEFVIGRQASEVDLVVEDEWVSRRHAKLSVDNKGYFKLEDLGSQNGILFEGRSVRRLNLVDGDVFAVGKTEFTFHADMSRSAAAAASTPPAAAPRGESELFEPPEPDPALMPSEPEEEG